VTTTLDKINVEITVVLGRTRMPIHKMLRMGRGSIIELEAFENDEVEILANDFPVARGQVIVNNGDISIEVTELIRHPEIVNAITLESIFSSNPI
jgi:flagellar motor switch protein FliN